MKRIAALLLALLILSAACLADSSLEGIGDIEQYLCSQNGASDTREFISRVLGASAGSLADWYAIAFAQNGEDMTEYGVALSQYAHTNEIKNAATSQRVALTLVLCGRGDDEFVQTTLAEKTGKSGIVTWIYALHLIKNGVSCGDFDEQTVTDKILSLQKEDGGWAVMGAYSDADVTAMALQALAGSPNAEDAINRALEFLSGAQQDNGGYSSYGVNNCESAAQVIIALCSLGIEPTKDARFIKNGNTALDALESFRLESGAYCHNEGGEANEMATAQALCAYVAIKRLENGGSGLFVYDADGVSDILTGETATLASASDADSAADDVISSDGNAQTGDNNESSSNGENASSHNLGGKAIFMLCTVGAAVLGCAVLILRGKRSVKSYIAVLLAAALVCLGAGFVDISTPDSYYGTLDAPTGEKTGSVTIEIRCDTVKGANEYTPADGVILPKTKMEIYQDDTVYDVLVRGARANEIQLDCENATGVSSKSVYVAGIGYIYELQFGDLSGWVYHVNGESPSVGCGSYYVNDGDCIEWLYTLDLGEDVK